MPLKYVELDHDRFFENAESSIIQQFAAIQFSSWQRGRITQKIQNLWDLYKIISALFNGVCEQCRTRFKLFASAGNFTGNLHLQIDSLSVHNRNSSRFKVQYCAFQSHSRELAILGFDREGDWATSSFAGGGRSTKLRCWKLFRWMMTLLHYD